MTILPPPIEKRALITAIDVDTLNLPINVFYAPLAGCSDYPFRHMSSIYQPGLQFCEMVKMEALIRSIPETLNLLTYSDIMRPIGAQLCGSNPSIAGQAARIVEDLGFDLVDLNCGCPVDKIAKDGSGSALLKMPQKIGEIVHEMVSKVTIPVTIKIRAGWDESHIAIEEVVRIAEDAGAKAITVHGRTREQGYRGKASREWIRLAKRSAKKIPVIANGDIFSPLDAFEMLSETGCDGVLIARGTMGSPWIVDQIRKLSLGEQVQERSSEELRQALFLHFQETIRCRSERKALLDMRRVGCWYFHSLCGVKPFREAMSRAQTLEEVSELILNYRFTGD